MVFLTTGSDDGDTMLDFFTLPIFSAKVGGEIACEPGCLQNLCLKVTCDSWVICDPGSQIIQDILGFLGVKCWNGEIGMPQTATKGVLPQGHVRLILFEPEGIAHTGKVRAEITKESYDRLET